MRGTASVWVVSGLLFGCGGDDEAASEPKSNCSIAVTLSGDVEATVDAANDAACAINWSLDSDIDVAIVPLAEGLPSVDLRIRDVTEGETGVFPTGVVVTTDDVRRYATSLMGCSVTLSEHRLEKTKMGELGEERHYLVVGTGSCSEPALAADMTGQTTLSEFEFRIPPIWVD